MHLCLNNRLSRVIPSHTESYYCEVVIDGAFIAWKERDWLFVYFQSESNFSTGKDINPFGCTQYIQYTTSPWCIRSMGSRLYELIVEYELMRLLITNIWQRLSDCPCNWIIRDTSDHSKSWGAHFHVKKRVWNTGLMAGIISLNRGPGHATVQLIMPTQNVIITLFKHRHDVSAMFTQCTVVCLAVLKAKFEVSRLVEEPAILQRWTGWVVSECLITLFTLLLRLPTNIQNHSHV